MTETGPEQSGPLHETGQLDLGVAAPPTAPPPAAPVHAPATAPPAPEVAAPETFAPEFGAPVEPVAAPPPTPPVSESILSRPFASGSLARATSPAATGPTKTSPSLSEIATTQGPSLHESQPLLPTATPVQAPLTQADMAALRRDLAAHIDALERQLGERMQFHAWALLAGVAVLMAIAAVVIELF